MLNLLVGAGSYSFFNNHIFNPGRGPIFSK
jgi:hypothetical protein